MSWNVSSYLEQPIRPIGTFEPVRVTNDPLARLERENSALQRTFILTTELERAERRVALIESLQRQERGAC